MAISLKETTNQQAEAFGWKHYIDGTGSSEYHHPKLKGHRLVLYEGSFFDYIGPTKRQQGGSVASLFILLTKLHKNKK